MKIFIFLHIFSFFNFSLFFIFLHFCFSFFIFHFFFIFLYFSFFFYVCHCSSFFFHVCHCSSFFFLIFSFFHFSFFLFFFFPFFFFFFFLLVLVLFLFWCARNLIFLGLNCFTILLRYTHVPTPLDDSTRPLDNSTTTPHSTIHKELALWQPPSSWMEGRTGGSLSIPTVRPCSQSGRRLWVARKALHLHEPNHEENGRSIHNRFLIKVLDRNPFFEPSRGVPLLSIEASSALFSFLFSIFCISFKCVLLLALVSEFKCFFRSRCSMEMWCLDDKGRDGWDWVGPPAWGRACFNSPEWRLLAC